MTASAALLQQLTIDDYAREAFCLDPNGAGFVQGGVYAGPLHKGADAQPWFESYSAPGDKRVSARARLLSVAPGKVFVRWANSHALRAGWKSAAGGVWWVTDNIADRIVDQTERELGANGDTGVIARQFGNVGYTWTGADGEPDFAGAPGTYRSDMKAVVVCRTVAPIKVLLGVGRPVVNPTLQGGRIQNVVLDSEELQVVMLTTIASPKTAHDPSSPSARRRFIGDQFLVPLFFGSSTELTRWWMREGLVSKRRTARILSARNR